MTIALDNEGWATAAKFVPLEPGEVQVWRARAEPHGLLADACRGVLAPDELERMARMRAGRTRNEFVIGRGMLRMLIGAAVARAAGSLVLRTGAHGKPWIEGLEFNVSHSHGLVVVALCRDAAVGIDVEKVEPGIEAMELAQGWFAPEEIRAIERAKEGAERTWAFYRCWARKEAVAKAHGKGLSLALKSFMVPTDDAREARVRLGADDKRREYLVQRLWAGEDFAGALAVEGEGWVVSRYDFGGLELLDGLW